MSLSNLADNLKKSKNAVLVVGAGISYTTGIPLGYRIPMEYGEAHQDLLKEHSILSIWQKANEEKGKTRETFQEQFVVEFIDVYLNSTELQQTFLDWLSELEAMSGVKSDIHAAFVIAWLNRVFKHLITTNWDFLLEYQIEAIYEEAYFDPFASITYTYGNGKTSKLPSDRLFFLEQLDAEDYFWHPRWDIVAQESDLENLNRWSRPVWKIHGSPFFLACPACGGFSRWKHTNKLTVGDPCPTHAEHLLQPELTFWGYGIDNQSPAVWKRLKGRLKRSDMIVVCGFSGAGSDAYLRTKIEEHPNTWVVNPDAGEWDRSSVNYIKGTASDLANMLISDFLT